ncbi:hypothetical protein F7725_017960 [Dissostichus mawsoni]|uniref:Uncharacterized protein n=1 Tax=Dissostichus mawsoni TaxID=36200 RepID=A0A7J5XQY3_DISMA|nr:hypothetical protein F7725_017960 [Dissostichus mawsoni]
MGITSGPPLSLLQLSAVVDPAQNMLRVNIMVLGVIGPDTVPWSPSTKPLLDCGRQTGRRFGPKFTLEENLIRAISLSKSLRSAMPWM